MLRRGISLWVFALAMTSAAWSDEPVPPQSSVKQQRVSPNVLREFLALPEYQGKTSAVRPAPPTLGDLQKLADRLKKSGDNEGADLLQRFVLAHQQLAKQSSLQSTSDHAPIDIQFKIVEVELNKLAPDSPLRDQNPKISTEEIRAELMRLVAAKKARMVTEPVMTMKLNQAARLSDGGEFPIPIPGENGVTTVEFREFGTIISVKATLIAKERLQLAFTCEHSTIDATNSIVIEKVNVPGLSKQKIQGTIETSLEQWVMMPVSISGNEGRQLFTLARVSHSR